MQPEHKNYFSAVKMKNKVVTTTTAAAKTAFANFICGT